MKYVIVVNSLAFSQKITNNLVFNSKVIDILVFSSKVTDILVFNNKVMDILMFSSKFTDILVFSSKVTDILVCNLKTMDISVFSNSHGHSGVQPQNHGRSGVQQQSHGHSGILSQNHGHSSVHQQNHHQSGIHPQIPPRFPIPSPGAFWIYLLSFCPTQVSTCYGCGASVKPRGHIPEPPYDLVIVSNMMRECRKDRQVLRKQANVYFHCKRQCISRRQPYFVPSLCSIPPVIRMSLTNHHHEFLKSFGTSI